MANNDLISRATLLNDLSYCAPELWQDEEYVKAKIMKHPTVDAAPVVHGHWVPDTWRGNDVMSGGSMATCSECGRGWLDTRRMRFCPNCGAKMDEEKPTCGPDYCEI